jgi:TonB family protein
VRSIFNFVTRPKSPDKKPLPACSPAASKQCTEESTSSHAAESLSNRDGEVQGSGEFFHTLEDVGVPQSALWASAGMHIAILIVLLLVPLIYTESIKVKYDVSLLAPPMPEKPQPLEVTTWIRPQPKLPAVTPVVPPREQPHVFDLPKPEEVRPPKIDKISPPEVPIPAPPKPVVEPQPVAAPPPKPVIHTGGFSSVAAAEPTKLQPRDVQTGGFGDPNGVVVRDGANRTANIAPLGSFDLPSGAGAGNGTGGARGVRTIAASSGFGGATAAGTSNGVAGGNRASELKLRQSGFGDVQAASASPPVRKADTGVPDTPAEITFKPKPDYTDDARKLRVEGEVLLRVLFSATGEVHVLEVVRGLGHGLDENATSAAQQIRFKPALRGGHPVDSTVTVHILFQLAF